MPEIRPVWLTREQIELLAVDLSVAHAVQDAWKAAPADATEAVWNALVENYLGAPCRQQIDAVLRALGCFDA